MMTFEQKLRTLGNRVSYNKKPEILSLEEWQIALRKQFGQSSAFAITNIGFHPYYSDFSVHNPENKNTYKVSIRKNTNTGNYCSCLDFKTNCLGTCKHIELVLYKLNTDKNIVAFAATDFALPYTSIYLKYDNERHVKIRIGTENSAEFQQLASEYFDKNFILKPDAFNQIESVLERARQINQSFRCYNDALEFILDIRAKNKRIDFLKSKYNPEIEENAFSHLINTQLFKYQKEGIWFAAQAGKCLIADEMGLGKTVQAIGLAELYKTEFGISKVLVVCPTSLKYQWKSEIEKFTQSSALVIEGMQSKREQIYRTDQSFYKIISYNTLSNDFELINSIGIDLLILDEAQRIKNWKTKIAQNVKRLKSDFVVVLTGTPLENKLEELYSIIQFVDAFALGPYYQFLNKHQIKNELGKIVGYKNLNRIGEELASVLIRRRRSEVLSQLPERMDKNLFVPMTAEQLKIHGEYADAVAQLVTKWKKFGFLNEKDRQRLMISLNSMRMVCDSTYILDQETRFDTKIEELFNILDEALEQPEQKVVIFSQWERMTRIVSQELIRRKIKFEYLYGGVASEKRKILLQNFANDVNSRIFLSTDAGGVGLNLQNASLLINIDIPWNPAVLEQRISRIYRLGQNRNVNIINLVSLGTIEQRMLLVLDFKASMAEGVLDNWLDTIFLGDDKFKEFMKTVEEIASPVENKSGDSSKESVDYAEEAEIQIVNDENEIKTIDSQDFQDNASEFETKHESSVNKIDAIEKLNNENSLQADLIKTGIDFFGKLAKTLADKEATQKLVSSLIEKDTKSGKTYVKIPIENEQVVENVFSILKSFLNVFQQK